MATVDRSGARGRIVVAGHLCLDVITAIDQGDDPVRPARPLVPEPGALDIVGPSTLAPGGCVGNTGVALDRLGGDVTLVARIGDDTFGRILADLVATAVRSGHVLLIPTARVATSYSIVHNRAGADRAIQHFPGANDAFVAADVPDELLASADLVHVGYPPLMAGLVADGGRELETLLARARAHGALTSLDLANVRTGEQAGGRPAIDWPRLLERVLPVVDVFLPSLDEARHLLRADGADATGAGSRFAGEWTGATGATGPLLGRMLDLGVAIAGVKCGADGLVIATGTPERLGAIPALDVDAWADRELHSSVFETDIAGTTGAGDTTIAGFLLGLVSGMTPEAALTAACAVGGASTERADGTSGVPSWVAIEARIASGWRRRAAGTGSGWTEVAPGIAAGPRDRRATRATTRR